MTPQVYFIACANQIKIGLSNNIVQRMQKLSCTNALPLKLLGMIDGSKRLERAIHEKLAPHRTNGEWFADGPEVRLVIAALMERGSEAIGFEEPCDDPAPDDDAYAAPVRQAPRSLAQAYMRISQAYADLAEFLLLEDEDSRLPSADLADRIAPWLGGR